MTSIKSTLGGKSPVKSTRADELTAAAGKAAPQPPSHATTRAASLAGNSATVLRAPAAKPPPRG